MTWLDDVIAVYGEPRIKPPTPEGVRLRSDSGDYLKRGWVWFPSAINHHISIETSTRREFDGNRAAYAYYTVRVGSHRKGMGYVEWQGRGEPDDELMRHLLAVTGFLTTEVV